MVVTFLEKILKPWWGSISEPSACEADVIALTTQKLTLTGERCKILDFIKFISSLQKWYLGFCAHPGSIIFESPG